MDYDYSMNEEAKIFGRNLKLLMDHYSDVQTSLAKKTGASQKTISNMLNPGDDRSPTLANIALVAKAYKVPTWLLLTPNISIQQLLFKKTESLIEIFNAVDDDARNIILRTAEKEFQYNSQPASQPAREPSRAEPSHKDIAE